MCAFRRAEAAVAADSSAYARHAELFEAVATRWPSYRYAPLAQYRAGLASLAAGDRERGVRSLWVVVKNFPRCDYVKDAYLQIARAEEAGGAGGSSDEIGRSGPTVFSSRRASPS